MQPLETDLNALISRVAKLELQNRLLKKGGTAVLLVAVAILTMGQAKSGQNVEVDTVKAKTITADTIQLSGQDGATTLLIPGFITVQTKDKDLVFISASSEGPSIQVIDKDGFQTAMGVTALETIKTGAKNRTSAAAVVLIGKDHRVLWSAP